MKFSLINNVTSPFYYLVDFDDILIKLIFTIISLTYNTILITIYTELQS